MSDDAALRRRALEVLGAFGEPLAREALEEGALVAEADGGWEGTAGHLDGVRAALVLEADVHARVVASPAAVDALVAAVAVAVADEPGRVLVDLGIRVGAVARGPARSPYR